MTKSVVTYPTMLTQEEAAARLGIAPSTLGIWRTTGRYNLPFVKVGSRVRYRAADVAAFIERRTRNPYNGPDTDA